MSMAIGATAEASSSGVADDWETGEAQQEEQLKSKQQQIRILKRDRDAAAQQKATTAAAPLDAAPVPLPPMAAPAEAKPLPVPPPPAMKLLRRPASGSNVASSDASKEERINGDEANADTASEGGKKNKTHEERMVDYENARSRILGNDYKPEEVKAAVAATGRSRSPELVKNNSNHTKPIMHEYSKFVEINYQGQMILKPGVPGGGVPLKRNLPPLQPPMVPMGVPIQMPPPHVVAAYQQMVLNATYAHPQQYVHPPPMPDTSVPPPNYCPPPMVQSTMPPSGYHDYYDALSSTGPLGSLPSMVTALPYNPSMGLYGQPPPPQSAYGRPPTLANPDIAFRHVPSSNGRQPPRRNQ